MYECKICLLTLPTKQQYVEHINSASCKKIEFPKEHGDFQCKYCDKLFDRKYNYDRHVENKRSQCYITSIFGKQLDKIHKEIKHSNDIKTGSVVQPIIQNNINNNLIKQEVLFARPGKESIDHITKDVMLQLLDQPNFTTVCTDLMRSMYFNKNVPQNNNWFIAYPKNGKAGVVYNHDTSEFERKSTVEIIDDKFSNMIDLLQPLIEKIYKEDELTDNLNSQQRKNIKLYYGHFGTEKISIESPEIYEALHDLSYNARVVPMTSWKEQGLNGKYLSLKF